MVTITHNFCAGRLICPLVSRGGSPPSQIPVWTPLGFGASILSDVYHETSFTLEAADSDESNPPACRPDANPLLPAWTDNGIYRVDVASLPANVPIEDISSLYTAAVSPTLRYSFFGIFDGHNGRDTARKLAVDLSEVVCLYLADVYSKCAEASPERHPGVPPNPQPALSDVHTAIKAAFNELDDLIVHEAAGRALRMIREECLLLNGERESVQLPLIDRRLSSNKLLDYARAGSCAILGVYNNSERTLHIALTGDSRAVLGRRIPVIEAGKRSSETRKYAYEVRQLSFDQNAYNPKEVERLTALHPGEPDLLKDDRLLGWGCARAFGDGVMKWSISLLNQLEHEDLRVLSGYGVKTPPYFTAEPEVTTFEGVRRGDFLVLASDGLWESLTNEEVVGLVGRWLEETGSKEDIRLAEGSTEVIMPTMTATAIGHSDSSVQEKDQTYSPSELPVLYPEDYEDQTQMYKYWNSEKRFISVADDKTNVATHVIRNALGGANRSLSEKLYMTAAWRRRRTRDDITIQVIFFE